MVLEVRMVMVTVDMELTCGCCCAATVWSMPEMYENNGDANATETPAQEAS